MSEGPTIGDWTQYGWIPDEVSSFPARVRLRDSAWMVYYEANVGDERERAEMLELREQNAKLRELVARMAEALGIDCEWADPNWCKSPCVLEFECWPESDHTELRCPAWAIMHELGIEVPE